MVLVLRLVALGVLLRLLRIPRGVADIEYELEEVPWDRRSDLLWNLALRGRLPIVSRIALGLPALYMMSPLDLVPDFVPFLGHMDDRVAVTTGLQIARLFAPGETLIAEIRRMAKSA